MTEASPHAPQDLPIGIAATGTRTERDSMGSIEVPADRYWGAQTQRSLKHFAIGADRMPLAVYRAYAIVKKAAAIVNAEAGHLPAWKTAAIIRAADEAIGGQFDDHFPLFVYQTGSGTQTNMNINEVLANRASQLLGGTIGSKAPIHPNDDLNLAQSSNDTFPTAMHIATIDALDAQLLPSAIALATAIEAKARAWIDTPKTGRTHLQDAVPLTVGQEWSGYAHQLRVAIARIEASRAELLELAAGGTAVGTGITAWPGFSTAIAAQIAALTGKPYVTAPNKFAAQAGLDALVASMAAIRGLAVACLKIANDMRWLASGPRCGIGELILPENEPGSSIMPGKINPTQCEAMVMVCIQVIGDDNAVAFAGSQGNFELNAMRPLIINNILRACRNLADACGTLNRFSVAGTTLNRARIDEQLGRSLMLVTALTPEIGYDRAAAVAHHAEAENLTLREAAIAYGGIDGATFDRIVDPARLVGAGLAGA
jgi:fumarate hydratase class II